MSPPDSLNASMPNASCFFRFDFFPFNCLLLLSVFALGGSRWPAVFTAFPEARTSGVPPAATRRARTQPH